MCLLCHPWFTATNLSYTFPILETSPTASCGTTGTLNTRWFKVTCLSPSWRSPNLSKRSQRIHHWSNGAPKFSCPFKLSFIWNTEGESTESVLFLYGASLSGFFLLAKNSNPTATKHLIYKQFTSYLRRTFHTNICPNLVPLSGLGFFFACVRWIAMKSPGDEIAKSMWLASRGDFDGRPSS